MSSNSESSGSSGSSASVSVEDATAAFREFREYARGDLDVAHHDVHSFAGLIEDDRTRHALEVIAESYHRRDANGEIIEDLPRDVSETEFMRRARKKYATDVATKAIAEGNLTQTSYITGLPSYKSDISGLHAINQLADWLVHSEQCKLIYMAALMGRGKTDLSVTFFEIIHDHFRRIERSLKEQGLDDAAARVPTPEFAANFHIETPDHIDIEVKEIHSEEELLDWAEGGSSDLERWFIFDEASTELTAQSGANAQKVAERMAPFVKKMRKLGINMITIGHDKGDIHVAIRSLADFVSKAGVKTASFYAGINKREPTGHLFDVSGIPETSWQYDTDDTAEWSWSGEEESEIEDDRDPLETDAFREWRNERVKMLYHEFNGLTQEDIGKAIGLDQRTVSDIVNNRMGAVADD